MILMNRYKKNDTCLLDKFSLLNPRTKKLAHLDKPHQQQVHESIRRYLASCYTGSESQPVSTPSITKSKTSSVLDDLLSAFSQPDNTTCSALSSASPDAAIFQRSLQRCCPRHRSGRDFAQEPQRARRGRDPG